MNVKTVFGGNQEAALFPAEVGRVAAAGVNSAIMARYGRREGFDYRALWTSDIYNDLCIMANPKVPGEKVAAVKAAFLNMAQDPAGRKILEAGARVAEEPKTTWASSRRITATTTITVPSSEHARQGLTKR